MIEENEDGAKISVEAEWASVDALLAKPDEAAWAMAVIEAHKIFIQVLDEVSYGENFDEKIHNASGLFRHPASVLAARKVFEHVVGQPGYKLSRKNATVATKDLLTGILDLIGRDYVEREWSDRLMAGMNYFWLNHPRFLVGILGVILVLVSGVWFLEDTSVGRWVAGLVVGFSRFVLGRSELFIALVLIFVFSGALSYWLVERRKR